MKYRMAKEGEDLSKPQLRPTFKPRPRWKYEEALHVYRLRVHRGSFVPRFTARHEKLGYSRLFHHPEALKESGNSSRRRTVRKKTMVTAKHRERVAISRVKTTSRDSSLEEEQ